MNEEIRRIYNELTFIAKGSAYECKYNELVKRVQVGDVATKDEWLELLTTIRKEQKNK